ncbi:hypothetical protein LF1_27320 [Rubripirellula obstinata]|uniref:Uncharacterized protein n=1 Tax=Rubripirellula obstinata TaxID=406547 RepID=A0A5B1CLF3_9BACT|nr:hypothetical protein [Rubripirellula obstinata]KAA1260193.1 hypothetical protein LF1_27320 [Rubripirellula obstinata]
MNHREQFELRSDHQDGFPSRRWRSIASVIVLLHVAAVILPPLAFQARGPLGVSPAIETAITPFEKYAQSFYIDRGYAFFAPDPGPSHLIQAAITDSDGNRVEELYPDLDQQWPRLLYHRHFMLAEYLEEIYHPPGPPRELAELDREAAEYWVRSRARYEHVRQSVVDHLKQKHSGQQVAIRRIEHLIPDLSMFIEQPIALDDPQLYRVLQDQPIDVLGDIAGNPSQSDADVLVAPTKPPETIEPPKGDPVEPADNPTNESAEVAP